MKLKGLFVLSAALLFLVAGHLVDIFSSTGDSDVAAATHVAKKLEREFRLIEEDFRLLENDQEPEAENLSNPIFVYDRGRLVYWSDNTYVPQISIVYDTFSVKLVTTASDAVLLKKKTLSSGKIAVSMIRLIRKYPINNDFFKTEYNERILPTSTLGILDVNIPEGHPVCIEGDCIFRVDVNSSEVTSNTSSWLTVILISISIVLLITGIYIFLPFFSAQGEEGFLYLLLSFLFVRFLMLATEFPKGYVRIPLFDPQSFAASSFNPSLGDLLFNVILLLGVSYYVFQNYFRFRIQKLKLRRSSSIVVGTLSTVIILFAGLFPVVVIQTLYNNSSIAIDLSQSLKFDFLRVVALLAIVISGICSFLFLHAFVRTLVSIHDRFVILVSAAMGLIIFTAINWWTGQYFFPTLIITVIYVVSVYLLKLYDRLKTLNFSTFGYLFVAILFLSINGAFTIDHFSRRDKTEIQFRFANNFLIDRDIFAEYLLNEAAGKIASDAFIQSRIASPFFGKEAIRQKIRQVFLPSYFNKFDVSIWMFNNIGEPLETGNVSLSEFLRNYDLDAYRTQYEGIRYVDNPDSDVAQKYLVIIPFNRGGGTGSHIVVELSLKKVIPENVYPELLVDYSYQQFYQTQELSYAVYGNGRPVFTSGGFNYEQFFENTLFDNSTLFTKGLESAGYFHIAVKGQEGKIAVVSARVPPWTFKLSNFSFFLTIGLFVLLLLIFVQGIYQYFKGNRLFFSARIQLYLNLAFFIPLIIVSLSTLRLTSQSSQQQLNDEYLSKSRVFGQQMMNLLNEGNDRSVNVSNTLEERLATLAKLSNLDANVFSEDGQLLVSSQPLIFERNLLSPFINSKALSRIRDGETLFVESEKVGSLEYFVSYSVLKSTQSGRTAGILAIPFFQSGHALEKIQSIILINILNVFALIFILLLVLSYIVADKLTFPLRFITNSLRRTSLTKINTPLTWSANDEIGFMVKEYNSMLYKLSESKNELEQTQREKAWREIAQQVAHEIKNPLTPMKLTLQQLERALQAGNNSTDRTQKAVTTLLEQVDTLDQIASSFSGFVKMPEPVMQQMDIVSVVKRVVDLHSPTGDIIFRTNVKEAWVSGDTQLLSRTFSNLILNSIQAAVPGRPIYIEVSVEVTATSCTIVFKDNGKGIDASIQDRVFYPHFSTKKSGSGLGLAIARQGIQQMNGKIWFESKPGAGTTFYIELPIINRSA